MIPNSHSYCEIDPDEVDEWGIPVLRFHFKWGDNEIKIARDMQETFKAIIEAAGGTYVTRTETAGEFPYGITVGGQIIHEVGTARMGTNPQTSW